MDGGGGAQAPSGGGGRNSAAAEEASAGAAPFPWETPHPVSNGNGSPPGSQTTTTTTTTTTTATTTDIFEAAAADPFASTAVLGSSSESSGSADTSPATFVENVLSRQSAVHLLNYALCGAVDETVDSEAAATKSTGSNHELDSAALASAKTLLQKTFQSTTRRVCCYMFKVGDLAFNCVQCQAHTTCVLCEQCFRNSDHEGHDVTFFRVSSVGGCCDCGDEAAWKPEGFCTHHGKTLALPDIFPSPGSRQRVRNVLTAVWRRIVEVLIEANPEHPRENVKPMALIVRGHAELQKAAIVALKEIVMRTGVSTAELTQRFRGLEMCDKMIACAGDDVEELEEASVVLQQAGWATTIQRVGALEAEEYCCQLVDWCCEICDVSEGFAMTVADILMEEIPLESPIVPTWLRQLFVERCRTKSKALFDRNVITRLWLFMYPEGYAMTTLRSKLHTLYIRLLGLPAFKNQFAIDYAGVYPLVARDICLGNIRHRHTLPVLGVQFLNRRNFVSVLVQNHGLLSSIVQALKDFLASLLITPRIPDGLVGINRGGGKSSRKVIDLDHVLWNGSNRLFYLSADMQYCLAHPDDARSFCREGTMFEQWLEIISLADGMHPQQRQCKQHVETVRGTWEQAFNFELMLLNISSSLFRWIALADPASDPNFFNDVVGVLSTVITRLQVHTSPAPNQKKSRRKLPRGHVGGDSAGGAQSTAEAAAAEDVPDEKRSKFATSHRSADAMDAPVLNVHAADPGSISSEEEESLESLAGMHVDAQTLADELSDEDEEDDEEQDPLVRWLKKCEDATDGIELRNRDGGRVFSASFHRPLQRVLAMVVRAIAAVDNDNGDVLLSVLEAVARRCGWTSLSAPEFLRRMRRMFHPSLRVLLLHSQISARLWVRNGNPISLQNMNYAKFQSMHGNDVVACQFWVLAMACHQNLLSLANDNKARSSSSSSPSDDDTGESDSSDLSESAAATGGGSVERRRLPWNEAAGTQSESAAAHVQPRSLPTTEVMHHVTLYFYRTFALTFHNAGLAGYEIRDDEGSKAAAVVEHAQVLLRAVMTQTPQFARSWRSEFKQEVVQLLAVSPRSYSDLESAYNRTTKAQCQKQMDVPTPEDLVDSIECVARLRAPQGGSSGSLADFAFFQPTESSARSWVLRDDAKALVNVEQPFRHDNASSISETFSLYYTKRQQMAPSPEEGGVVSTADLKWRLVIPPPPNATSRFYRSVLWSFFSNPDILGEMLRTYADSAALDADALRVFAAGGTSTSPTGVSEPLAEQLLWHLVWTLQCNRSNPEDCMLSTRWWSIFPSVVALLSETLSRLQEPLMVGPLKALAQVANSRSAASGKPSPSATAAAAARASPQTTTVQISAQELAQQRAREAMQRQQQDVMATMFGSSSSSSSSESDSGSDSESDEESSGSAESGTKSATSSEVSVATAAPGEASKNSASAAAEEPLVAGLVPPAAADVSDLDNYVHLVEEQQCIICHGRLDLGGSHSDGTSSDLKDPEPHNTPQIMSPVSSSGVAATSSNESGQQALRTVRLLGFVHRSSISPEPPVGCAQRSSSAAAAAATTTPTTTTMLRQKKSGYYITSCHHFLHEKCWQDHHAMLKKNAPRLSAHKRQLADVDQNEFFCMKCNSISNVALPILVAGLRSVEKSLAAPVPVPSLQHDREDQRRMSTLSTGFSARPLPSTAAGRGGGPPGSDAFFEVGESPISVPMSTDLRERRPASTSSAPPLPLATGMRHLSFRPPSQELAAAVRDMYHQVHSFCVGLPLQIAADELFDKKTGDRQAAARSTGTTSTTRAGAAPGHTAISQAFGALAAYMAGTSMPNPNSLHDFLEGDSSTFAEGAPGSSSVQLLDESSSASSIAAASMLGCEKAWALTFARMKSVAFAGASIIADTAWTLVSDGFTEAVLHHRDTFGKQGQNKDGISSSVPGGGARPNDEVDARPVDVTHLQTLLYSMKFATFMTLHESQKTASANNSQVAPAQGDNNTDAGGACLDESSHSHFGAMPGADAHLETQPALEREHDVVDTPFGTSLSRVFASWGSSDHSAEEFRRVLRYGDTGFAAVLIAVGAATGVEFAGRGGEDGPIPLSIDTRAFLSSIWTLFVADCANLLGLAAVARASTAPSSAGASLNGFFGLSDMASPKDSIAAILRAAAAAAGGHSRFDAYVDSDDTTEHSTNANADRDATSLEKEEELLLSHAQTRADFYLFVVALVRRNDPHRGLARGRMGSALRVSTVHTNAIALLAETCGVHPAAPFELVRMQMFSEIIGFHEARAATPSQQQALGIFAKLPGLLTLHELPHAFTDLYALGSKDACASCGKIPMETAICLLCGSALCLSKCHPNPGGAVQQVGTCTTHMKDHHQECGLVVAVHTANILLIFRGHAIKLPPPYIDRFGETLRDRRRGRPMFLDDVRMRMLRRMWASHALTPAILRQRLTATRFIIYGHY